MQGVIGSNPFTSTKYILLRQDFLLFRFTYYTLLLLINIMSDIQRILKTEFFATLIPEESQLKKLVIVLLKYTEKFESRTEAVRREMNYQK